MLGAEKEIRFPENFFWGAATSAHQVEGNNNNDWADWEMKNAKSLAQNAAKKHWPNFILKNWPNPLRMENYISGRACDHYSRFEEDFNITKSLGHNAHRFSIEWSRVEPEEGKFSEKEIEHYRYVIRALRARGIEPFVTLWHWTLPRWFFEKQGFERRENIYYFARFCEFAAQKLKDEIKFWIVLNEPEIYSANSYLKASRPPQKKNLFIYLRVIRNLISAHREAYKMIKKENPNAKIGVAKNNVYFEACRNRLVNRVLKKFVDWPWNFYFLDRTKDCLDFIGLNYYFHNRINFGFYKNENKMVSDTGWEIYPEGIYHVLKDLKKYGKPVHITENGLDDTRDALREKFIKEHLFYVHKAIREGVDVRGYFYWSLMDNFEWDKGFWPRFGLLEIDYKTMERKIRPSAKIYAEICRNNGFDFQNG